MSARSNSFSSLPETSPEHEGEFEVQLYEPEHRGYRRRSSTSSTGSFVSSLKSLMRSPTGSLSLLSTHEESGDEGVKEEIVVALQTRPRQSFHDQIDDKSLKVHSRDVKNVRRGSAGSQNGWNLAGGLSLQDLPADPIVDAKPDPPTPKPKDLVILPPPATKAYAFYATDENYACSAIVAVTKLLETYPNGRIDILLLHLGNLNPDTLQAYHKLSTSYNLLDVEIKLDESLVIGFHEYYRFCLAKIYVFTLTQYDRVVVMDSDGFPLRNLDHLFDTPMGTPVAGAQMYWGNKEWFTSAFMVVEPSLEVFEELKAKVQENPAEKENLDMDLLNVVMKGRSGLLDPEYCCLNSHWETQDASVFGTDDLVELYEKRCYYLHYAAVGKPWWYRLKMEESYWFHQLLKTQFEMWESVAREKCSVSYLKTLNP
ncbi:hypothetical protein HDU98_000001 [Podochytrium sp. JEL0797]|nr:hypothetical protein HDU98_000001 [Podochytrium sp. JEL0797]